MVLFKGSALLSTSTTVCGSCMDCLEGVLSVGTWNLGVVVLSWESVALPGVPSVGTWKLGVVVLQCREFQKADRSKQTSNIQAGIFSHTR